MDERPCVHVFAPCPNECTSFNYRATIITDKTRRELRWSMIRNFIALTVAFIVVGGSVLLLIASIYPQAARNISNYKTAMEQQ